MLKPVLLNAYLYCASDPINNIDPTGMAMLGDENLGLTPEQVAGIEVFSEVWFAARDRGDQAAMDAAHAGANDIRYGQPDVAGVVTSPRELTHFRRIHTK